MQNNIWIGVDHINGETPESVATQMGDALAAKGFEVNHEIVGYRLLMFRKNSRQWSQIYKRTRGMGDYYITCHGEEKEEAVKQPKRRHGVSSGGEVYVD